MCLCQKQETRIQGIKRSTWAPPRVDGGRAQPSGQMDGASGGTAMQARPAASVVVRAQFFLPGDQEAVLLCVVMMARVYEDPVWELMAMQQSRNQPPRQFVSPGSHAVRVVTHPIAVKATTKRRRRSSPDEVEPHGPCFSSAPLLLPPVLTGFPPGSEMWVPSPGLAAPSAPHPCLSLLPLA